MPRSAFTFARFVATPENRGAWVAVQDLAEALSPKQFTGQPPLVMLHGPAGTGKTHLVQALVATVTHRRPDLVVCLVSAADLLQEGEPGLFEEESGDDYPVDLRPLTEARHSDLFVVEDLQHLNARLAEPLVQAMDYLEARQRPMVFTASAGPQRLIRRGRHLPSRLTNRLAGGLVVGLDPLGPASRLTLLQALAQRRQLAVPTAVLRWVAEHFSGGGRRLEGALTKLEALARTQRQPLDEATVEKHFRDDAAAGQPTVERIAESVGGYFQVEPKQLQSARRHREVLLPRQVGMYIARQLTGLSMEQIGAYFGGRDHATVLHACRKVEKAIAHDVRLSGLVRDIHADFT
jgi:chromosomal replication initiator protein